MKTKIILYAAWLICWTSYAVGGVEGGDKISLLRVPSGGIQPQVVVDGRGIAHMVYFKGDPGAGDLFYTKWDPFRKAWAPSRRVNSLAGSAVAAGTIRGGQLAVGKGGRVHVLWNGSQKAVPSLGNGAPLLYARSNDTGDGFEPQRNLIQSTYDLDGGGSLAADGEGNVYVVWSASDAGHKKEGEAGRRVWVAVSRDEGRTFSGEKAVNPKGTGACGCCGVRATVDKVGRLGILYRAAERDVERDLYLLVSETQGKTFKNRKLDKWHVQACPMTRGTLTEGPANWFPAWETKGQVFFSSFNPRLMEVAPASTAPVERTLQDMNRKHPALAVNAQGKILLVWLEGTGWQKGGDLAWQEFDGEGHPASSHGRMEGVPVWGLAAVWAEPDGSFKVVY